MKESLRVLVRADYDPTFTKSLNLSPYLLESGDEGDDDKSFCVVVSFSAEKDRDIAELVSKVKSRKLGAFIKNAMRLLIGPYYVLGCFLNGDEKLNNAYQDRKLFFVNGGFSTVIVEKKEKKKVYTPRTKKTETKKEEVSLETHTLVAQESTYFEPEMVKEPVKIPVASGEEEVFSDDDILSLLENM